MLKKKKDLSKINFNHFFKNDDLFTFFSEINHKIGNSITIFNLVLYQIKDKISQLEHQTIQSECLFLGKLFSEIIKILEIENNSLQKDSFDFSSFLKNKVNYYQDCSFKIENNLFILADHKKFSNALDLILENFLKIIETKSLSFVLKEDSQYALLTIKGNNKNKEEKIKNVFDLFYFPSKQKRSDYTGISFFLAQKIIEKHQGKVSFKTEKNPIIISIKLPLNKN